MLALPIMFALAGAPLSAALTDASEVVITRRELRIADVARLSGGTVAQRARVGASVAARLPQGRRSLSLSRVVIADLVTRSASVRVSGVRETSVTIRFDSPAAAGAGTCQAAATDLPSGTALTRESLVEASCGEAVAHGLVRYDPASHRSYAAVPVQAGTMLGHLVPADTGVTAGAGMTLLSRSGPVEVSRAVTTLQPSRPGRRIFVRDADGVVMAVRVQADAGAAR